MQEFFGSYEFPPFEVINTFEVDGSKVSVWYTFSDVILSIKKFAKLWNKMAICKRFGRRVYCKYLTFRRHWEGKTFVIMYTGLKAFLLLVRMSEGILTLLVFFQWFGALFFSQNGINKKKNSILNVFPIFGHFRVFRLLSFSVKSPFC